MKIKKILGFLQILCLVGLLIPAAKVMAVNDVGLGDIGYTETRDVAKGVELDRLMGTNGSGVQKAYTVEIEKGALEAFSTYGTFVNGGEKLTSMIAKAEADTGKKVVAAINGDFYDTSNGVPLGIMISNGKFVTSGTSPNSHPAIGFKADGTAIYGTPSISIKVNDGTKDIAVKYFNVDRKFNETDIFMYSEDYGTTTKNTETGKEVVLNITAGEMKLGGTVSATVQSVGSTNASIGENQIVISTATANASKLDGLTVGKQVTISITDNKANEGWSQVVQAIGFNAVLAENGVLTGVTSSDTAIHPRSAIGIKADGSIVLFQVDGRQPGWSIGLSYRQIAEHLVNEKGCQTVVNLDGGGSSTLTVRLPGNEDAEILNVPSDGVERSNSNAILFFAKDMADPDHELAHLHTYPKNLVILEGAKTNIVTKATDENFFPVDTPTDISYAVSSGIGTIDENGMFTAQSGEGTGTITVTSGSISATVDVTVVDTIGNVIADKTYLSIAPGEQVEFSLSAYKDGMPITCSNASFTWELSSPVLGTIADGVFQGTNGSAAGFIYISYKSFKLTIPVEVGKQPIMISTFEEGENWVKVIENPGNGGVGEVSVNTDERFVKFGKQSLRIDYDFSKATNTTSVTAAKAGGSQITLEGYPSHIGMWVYGDMAGANIRLMLYAAGAVQYLYYVPDVVNWEGWKYIEVEIPEGLPTPLSIRYPIRVMSVSGKVKSSGTLYFDNIRAVYGFRNDDLKEPQVKDLTPEEGSTVDSKQPLISLKVWDEPDENKVITGINKESIKMWINNEEVENVLLVDNPDGTISVNYNPSALTLLTSGPQVVKVRIEDNYGNITIKQWQFYVSGDYVGVNGVIPDKNVIYAGDSFTYVITGNTYENFEKLETTLNFNHKALEIKNVIKADSRITLNAVDIANANATGKLNLVATGMKNYPILASKEILKINFQTKAGFTGNSDSRITFTNTFVHETGLANPRPFLLPSYEAKVNYRYILTYITSTVGRNIRFKVTDPEMNPVEGAKFEVTGQNITLTGTTDVEGYVTFSEFASLAVNSTFNIRAIKGTNYSETLKITMVASLGSDTPNQIMVSPGEDVTTSVKISWQTNLSTTDSVLKYRKVGESNWKMVTQAVTKDIHVIKDQAMQEYLAHIVSLTGLTPDTEYEYSVGSAISNKYSEVAKFKTAPAEDVSILFLGDPQNTSVSGYTITKNLIDQAKLANPKLAMMLISGDLVDDGNMYAQWNALETVLKSYLSTMITASASGNHDVSREYCDPLKYALSGPNNGLEDVLGVNYFFEIGNTAIAVIDTETPAKFADQGEWLKEKMQATDKKFKIVLMHRSPYATNYEEPYIRDFWPRIFEAAGVDLVLSGHDHIYNSATLYNEHHTSAGYGVTYVSGGSSGSKFYNSNNLHERYWVDFMYDDDNPVYTILNMKGNILTLETFAFIDGVSESINTIVIDKSIEKPKTIAIEDKKLAHLPGTEFQFTASLKDEEGNPFAGTVQWELSEAVPGVSISADGLLKIDAGFAVRKDITVIARFEHLEARHDVKLYGSMPQTSEVISDIIDSVNDMIIDIYR